MIAYQALRAKDKCNRLVRKYYYNRGIILKYEALEKEILSSISADSKVLDAGCGYDAALISKYHNRIGEAVGVDLVKEFRVKPGIKTHTASLESLPFKNGYFDLIISRDVCEHIANPLKVFEELKRVLKVGGKIIMLTPNKYSYTSIISVMLPTSFKKLYLKTVFGEGVYDNFPTFYRCNTKQSIRMLARKSGLILDKFLAIRHYPYYLKFSVTLFRIGILYDKFITFLGLDILFNSFLFVLIKKEVKR